MDKQLGCSYRGHFLPRRLPVGLEGVLGMAQESLGLGLCHDGPGLRGDPRPGEHQRRK
jgi:hypothetical protein